MKLAWVSDAHLDFVDEARAAVFADELGRSGADALLVGGDIAQAPSAAAALQLLAARFPGPVWFVLGNHDFYRGSIAAVRAQMRSALAPRLRWLPEAGIVPLTASTALLGHDGWGDARAGNWSSTPIRLNDFAMIAELRGRSRESLIARLRALGDEAASFVRARLPEALERFRHVVFLTHVPPFRETCWHQGRISEDDWLPYFTCQAVGEALLEAMRARADRELTVLCGHTHGAGYAELLPNLRVFTAGADYGRPRLERLVEVD